jgi:hypothetical protein
MNTGPEAFAGGALEQPHDPVTLVPDPLRQERALFDQTLGEAAEFWAPGPGSADWDNWPEATAPQPDVAIPGLVRIGTRQGEPILTSLLSERHLVVGNAALLIPSRIRQVRSKEVALVKTLEAEAEQEYQEREAERRRRLEAERAVAVSVSKNLITRSIASMPPGSVDLTVIDSRDRGQAFRGFAPMGQVDRFRVAKTEQRSELLRSLDDQIVAMNSGALGGHRTLRSQIRSNGTGSHPWRIVVLLGHNEFLNLDDSDRLRNIMQQGPAAGISMIIHGFSVPDMPYVNRLGWAEDGQVRTTITRGWNFQLDPTAPEGVIRQTALNAMRKPKAPPRRSVPAVPPAGLAVPGSANRVPLPGANYQAILANHGQARRVATETMRRLQRLFPLFTGDTLTGLNASSERYVAFANLAARSPALARNRLAHPAAEGGVPELNSLEGWAMLDLLARTPGHTRDWFTQLSRGTITTGAGPESKIPLLLDAVQVTQRHGRQLIPEQARGYVLQYLGDEPPAYAFHLVADLGATVNNRVAVKPSANEARDASIFHLEQTYGVRLRDSKGAVNGRVLDALTECEILRLYDFPNATIELRVLLAQRAHERLEAVAMDELPEDARKVYVECRAFLAERGGPILSQTQRAGRAAGGLASRAATGALSWAKERRKKGDGEPETDNAPPRQIEQRPATDVAGPHEDPGGREERLRRLAGHGQPHIYRPDER